MRRVEPIFQPLKRKRGSGETSKEVVQSAISLPSAFEMAEPVSHSTQSPMTLAQYQVDNPSQPIIRESGLVENLEVNTISPPPLGFVTEVSSSPERQNIRRRKTPPSTSVVPLTFFGPVNRQYPYTRTLPLKPTNIIAPVAAVLTKAAAPEREESYEERLLKKYHEDRDANEGRVIKKFYETMEAKSVRKPCSGGLPKSNVVKHRPTPSESLQQRTRVWVESTLEK